MGVYGMNTLRRRFFALVTLTLLWVAGPACQRKCQPPSDERPTTITANPWRLVDTNDPTLAKANTKYTFYVISFAQDFSGDMKKVVNNREFETPINTLKYNLETDNGRSGFMRVAYFEVGAGAEGDIGGEVQAASEPSQTVDYEYTLTRELNLTASRSGYSYRFVPYVGIVDPDNNCTF